MNKNKMRVAVIALSGFMTIAPITTTFAASISDAVSLGGLSFYLDQYYSDEAADDSETSLLSKEFVIPEGIAIANVNDSVRIREKAGTNSNIVGTLSKNGACVVLDYVEDGKWAYVKSGDIVGYISCEYLFTGDAGVQKAKEVVKLVAEVTAGKVNVRSTPSTENEDNIIAEVTQNEKLDVLDYSSKELLTKNDSKVDLWVKVVIDNEEGYVAAQFVKVGYSFHYATKPPALTKSSLRNSIITEAEKHLGLRYVWGGESLTSGADCSGFVRAVYKKAGVNIAKLSRTSYGMSSQKLGREVSLANAQAGDIVFYADSRGNVNHVAMYMGDGRVIHESGYASGCKISKVNYRTIYKIKNFLD